MQTAAQAGTCDCAGRLGGHAMLRMGPAMAIPFEHSSQKGSLALSHSSLHYQSLWTTCTTHSEFVKWQVDGSNGA